MDESREDLGQRGQCEERGSESFKELNRLYSSPHYPPMSAFHLDIKDLHG